MIDREHDLPITRQAEVLRISRGSVYYLPRPVPEADLAIMRRLDRLHLEFPFAGARMLRGLLVAERCKIGRPALPHQECYRTNDRQDWGRDTESDRCRRWRDASAWARGARSQWRWRSATEWRGERRRGGSSTSCAR